MYDLLRCEYLLEDPSIYPWIEFRDGSSISSLSDGKILVLLATLLDAGGCYFSLNDGEIEMARGREGSLAFRNMHRRRSRVRRELSHEVPAIVRLWVWRLHACFGAQGFLFDEDGVNDALAMQALGLEHCIGGKETFSYSQAQAQFQALYDEAEQDAHKLKAPQPLRKNVSRLAKLVGLSKTDCRILEFAILIQSIFLLHRIVDRSEEMSKLQFVRFLGRVLDLHEKDVRDALSPKGMLTKAGLFEYFPQLGRNLSHAFGMKSESFSMQMFCEDVDATKLLRSVASESAAPELALADYAHLAQSLDVLRAYLKVALAMKRKGVNVFVYGPPGTGKTQLARVLAKELSCTLFEVSSTNEDEAPLAGHARLRAFCMAQVLLQKNASALILLDEMDDAFSDGDSANPFRVPVRDKGEAQYGKARKNQILEENPIPTIWVSNTRAFDAAFLRRFDVVLEMPVPPKKQRERILHAACADLFSPSEIGWIAESETLAPAVVARAASVARLVKDELGLDGARAAFENLMTSTLEAQGHKPPRKHDPARLPEIYDPAFIHADTDLSRVTEQLFKARAGRLCLYGPPGTGKTAYGRFLAEQLGAPLCVRRASDLLSKWVGESEQNIAHAFHRAEQEGGVLLIDEADTFLQDRRDAKQRWEVSLVNEMLTQIESFPGVLIASTNLLDIVDQAVFRRFDLKVKFDFLKPEQAAELLRRHCCGTELSEPSRDEIARVQKLTRLTPGDFATVMRQSRLAPFRSCAELIAALEAEVALKENAHAATIGFLH